MGRTGLDLGEELVDRRMRLVPTALEIRPPRLLHGEPVPVERVAETLGRGDGRGIELPKPLELAEAEQRRRKVLVSPDDVLGLVLLQRDGEALLELLDPASIAVDRADGAERVQRVGPDVGQVELLADLQVCSCRCDARVELAREHQLDRNTPE